MRTVLGAVLSLAITGIAVGQQTSGGLQCDSHTVAIDRIPGAKSVLAQAPDPADSRKILDAEFSGFDPDYSFESVRFTVLFVQDPSNVYDTVGTLRVLALLRSQGSEHWRELSEEDDEAVGSHIGYDDWRFSRLLHVRFMPSKTDEDTRPSDDPMIGRSGRPQARIQQAESGKPVFLLKFIGLTAAGGWGDVDTEEAIVLDLRRGDLTSLAAVGCVKNDFAGQNHEDEWVECHWSSQRQD